MKKVIALIFICAIITIQSVSFPVFATTPSKDVLPIESSLSYGQIQTILETFLEEQDLGFSIGSPEFYQYAWEQVYGETDPSLIEHPQYIPIDAYLTRYILMYQDYLRCLAALEQDKEFGETLIAHVSADNPCLIYDSATEEFSFVLTDRFLDKTLAEHKAENYARVRAAELARSETSSTREVYNYNPSAAIVYAKQYANGANPAFPDYRYVLSWPSIIKLADCTNFVSQCIYAGGLSMVGTRSLPGEYITTSEWFSRRIYENITVPDFAVSSSWINADDFSIYMTYRANKKYIVNTVNEVFAKCRPGDVVQWVKKSTGDVHHSVLISSKDSSTAYFCSHSVSHDGSLSLEDSIRTHFNENVDYFIIFSFQPNTTSEDEGIDECGQCADIPRKYYTQFHSATLDRVIVCPTHETHDAEVYQYRYDAYCSIHDNYVGSIYETEYVCLN